MPRLKRDAGSEMLPNEININPHDVDFYLSENSALMKAVSQLLGEMLAEEIRARFDDDEMYITMDILEAGDIKVTVGLPLGPEDKDDGIVWFSANMREEVEAWTTHYGDDDRIAAIKGLRRLADLLEESLDADS